MLRKVREIFGRKKGENEGKILIYCTHQEVKINRIVCINSISNLNNLKLSLSLTNHSVCYGLNTSTLVFTSFVWRGSVEVVRNRFSFCENICIFDVFNS